MVFVLYRLCFNASHHSLEHLTTSVRLCCSCLFFALHSSEFLAWLYAPLSLFDGAVRPDILQLTQSNPVAGFFHGSYFV